MRGGAVLDQAFGMLGPAHAEGVDVFGIGGHQFELRVNEEIFDEPRQPLAGEADILGFGARQRVGGERGTGSEQAERGRDNLDGSHGRLPFGLSGPYCLAAGD